jgi:glycosyltransferase involved in cell wall biosynthesis
MKKILHISNTDILSDSRILKEIESLSLLPLVSLFAVGIKTDNSKVVVNGGYFICKFVKIHSRILSKLPKAIRYFFEIIEFTLKIVLYGISIKPGIVHCHDTFALPSGVILKLLTNCKVVYDAHELESSKNSQNIFLSKSTLLIERICWSKIDLFISVSNSIIDWYMSKFGFKNSVLVLNSPLYDKDFIFEKKYNNYLRDYFNIPIGQKLYIYLGVLGYGRGIDIYLNTFVNFKSDNHLIFLGSGDMDCEIKNYSLKYPNIHLHPPVSHNLVVPIVASADFGLCLIENVSLSDYYCLPNKLFEYAFAGISVIGSNFPEISDVIDKHQLGLTCEPSAVALSNVIKYISEENKNFVSSNLSVLDWSSQSKRLNSAYLENFDI